MRAEEEGRTSTARTVATKAALRARLAEPEPIFEWNVDVVTIDGLSSVHTKEQTGAIYRRPHIKKTIAATTMGVPSGSRWDADGPDKMLSALKWSSTILAIPVVHAPIPRESRG